MTRILAAVALALLGSAHANAQLVTPHAVITEVTTGWSTDLFGVVTAGAMLNPAGCSNPGLYITVKEHGGYQTHVSTLLTAYALNKQVAIALHNSQCLHGRPVIIGSYVR